MFSKVNDILKDLKKGKMIIIVDDESRENEGDLVLAGEFANKENINFIIKNAKGLLCSPINEEVAKKLNLYKMENKNNDPYRTNWLISVDAIKGVTTGISPYDRALTIKKLANPKSKDSDFSKPGHVFPLLAKKGGVLTRAGHTEATIDLLEMAKLKPVGVICEIINEDGTMARLNNLLEFSKKHNIKIISIEEIIKYKRKKEKQIELVSTANLPTDYGNFIIKIYKEKNTDLEHVALIKGDFKKDEPVLVRVHSECLTGDVFFSKKCDCGSQLHKALEIISKEKKGVLLYMRQEGRGIGLGNKIKAYHLQDKGLDTVDANLALGFKEDLRDYGIGAQILSSLGIKKMKLMTNNPKKVIGLKGYGLEINEIIPIRIKSNLFNKKYLETKKTKMGHWL